MNRTSIKVVFTVLLLGVASAVFAEHVTVQTAQQAAQSFLNSKMEGNPQIQLIDFAEKSSFPNFYVFGNEHCFAIIAADNCVHPVLGYSTEGGFGTIDIPDAVSDWLKAYDREISSIKECKLVSTMEIRSEWEGLLISRDLKPKSRSHVNPLIRTRWGQSTPFNDLCPVEPSHSSGHTPAGCGAIAMAQIMNYWEHPVRGVDSNSYTPKTHQEYGLLFADFGNTVYDWDNMKNDYSRCYSDTEAEAVATLVYHCGVSVEMDYGPISSSVRKTIMDDAFRNFFNYNPLLEYYSDTLFTNEQWIARLKNDLDNGQPVLYRGSNFENDNGGHIFVCDGYDENNLFHINWGWNGSCDGFFIIGALHPGADYSYHNYAIFDCYPNPTTLNPPSNVNIEVEGRDVTITWTMVTNASYYRLYRDDDLIENHLTSLSYVDENVFYGTHSYYLKSVESDGTMSLRSNVVVADVSGPMPTNLQAVVNNHDVILSWDTPTPESAILQYGTGSFVQGFPVNNNQGIYWAQRHPASVLSNYIGMAINKVSVFFKSSGNYLMQLYLGDECGPEELLYQRDYEASAESWQDINVDSLILIDFTQDLWVVMFGDSSIVKPATWCSFSGTGVENSAYYSFNGNNWLTLPGNYRSWMMKTYLTDGTYTYNLYRNGNVVATNLTGNSYTDSNLPDGFYNYHVSTNYFGGESDPSNNVNVQIGTPSSQMSSFAGGWNWWSSYVELGGASGLQMLEEGLGANGSMIKSQTQFVQCNGGVWSGGLNGINNESSYKIQTLAACEVETNGSIASPLSHPITLNPGWNWIGYPCHTAMSVTTAFSGITPSDGDEVKSQGGFSQYLNGMWSGSLNTIIPGMGLLYHSNNGQVVTLVYPEIDRDAELGENVTAEDNHWFSDIHAYPNNMTVTAVVELDGEELKSEQYELAVFSGDECRGSVRLMRVGHADRYMAFLTVSGDEITELRFGLYDTESGEEYCNAETALTYETDVTVGNVGDPYVVRFRGATDKKEDAISQVLVFPNPANDMLTIQGEGIIRVAVLNVIGQVVEDLESEDQKQICMNVHDYEQALYFLRIQTESGTVIKRFIKK